MERPRLSLFDVLCLGLNAIVGSGIYAFPGALAAMLGHASPLAFAICGAVALLIGLCFAEAAGMYERSGGPYVYACAALGPTVGYLVGWTCWTAALLSLAAVARAAGPYLAAVLPAVGTGPWAPFALTVGLGLLNFFGLKPGAYTTDVLTAAKILPLLALLGVGIPAMSSEIMLASPVDLSALPHAVFMVFFAFQGFEVVPVPAGETARPRRNAPLALLLSLAGATLLYVALQTVAVGSTPNLAGSREPLALMGLTVLGPAGGTLVAAAAAVSMIGFCSGVALAGPRYIEALALDGHLPAQIARRHSRFGTPSVAVLGTSLLAACLVLLLDFARLVDLSVLTVGVQYVATCLAVPILRWRQPQQPRAFRVPLGPIIPLLAVCIFLFLGAQAGLRALAWFGVLVVTGLPLRLLSRRAGGRQGPGGG